MTRKSLFLQGIAHLGETDFSTIIDLLLFGEGTSPILLSVSHIIDFWSCIMHHESIQ